MSENGISRRGLLGATAGVGGLAALGGAGAARLGLMGGAGAAALACLNLLVKLGLPRENILGFTMPGFATSEGTKSLRRLLTDQGIVIGYCGGDFARGTGRSFDFQNLASEGVSTLEVYKTGRANVASGGIGSTINIRTPRPLAELRDELTAQRRQLHAVVDDTLLLVVVADFDVADQREVLA